MLWRRRTSAEFDPAGIPTASYDVTLTQIQFGEVVVVRASALPTDPPYWQWYLHGQPAGLTRASTFGVSVGESDAVELRALALETPDIDPWDYATPTADGRVTLEWADADDDTIALYRIDYAYSAPSGWAELGTVVRDGRWRYVWVSPRFDSGLALYLRVVPVTAAGDDGTVLEVGPIGTARRPDAPTISVSYAAQQITVS